MHVENEELYKVALWKKRETNFGGYVAINSLNEQDVRDYLALSDQEKEVISQLHEAEVQLAAARRRERDGLEDPTVLEVFNDDFTQRVLQKVEEMKDAKNVRRYDLVTPAFEVKRDSAYATTVNGERIPLKHYTEVEKNEAAKIVSATATLTKAWKEGKTTWEDSQAYLKAVEESGYYSREALLELRGSFSAALAVLPKNSRVNAPIAMSLFNTVRQKASDVLYGYEEGSCKKHEPKKKFRHSKKKTKPVKETTATKTSAMMQGLKGWVKSWKYTEI